MCIRDRAREELDRLWQGEPSGSRSGCKSPFGVYDMTGNVDEWTRSVNTTGYASILKGGYWGPVRARCRPATRAHNEDFVAYQQSFRCCAEASVSVPAPSPVAAMALLVDAGSTGVVAQGDAGFVQRPSVDLEAERTPSSDDDEVDAITKRRVALCLTAPLRRDAGGPTPSVLTGLGIAATLFAIRRRSRH